MTRYSIRGEPSEQAEFPSVRLFPTRVHFAILEDDGIRQVFPGISSKYFVSSSEAGKPADYISYGFDGEFGGIDAGCNGMASLRCVAR
jgi:hypothetical protein